MTKAEKPVVTTVEDVLASHATHEKKKPMAWRACAHRRMLVEESMTTRPRRKHSGVSLSQPQS
jgi:hypothetical protein